MTTRTSRPVSKNPSPEAPSPFCGDQDEEPNHLVAEYEQLWPGGLDEGAIEEDDNDGRKAIRSSYHEKERYRVPMFPSRQAKGSERRSSAAG